MPPYKRSLIILADGARPDVFRELSDAGRLPHCDEVFRNRGLFSKATSVFPSTTGPAYLPFLTGCYPGTCNLPGIRWFDKKAYGLGRPWLGRHRSYVGIESILMGRDIAPHVQTLFQKFNRPMSLFSPISKGAGSGNRTWPNRIWYWYYAHLTDHWDLVDAAALQKTLQAFEQGADFVFVVFPGIDEFSHLSDPRDPRTLLAYEHLDAAIGTLQKKLKDQGCWDETLLFVVSDHGLSRTHQHFGLGSFLESNKLKTFYYPKIFKWNFDAASMVSGNGMAHLYFRNPGQTERVGAWTGRLSFERLEEAHGDLIGQLLAEEAVDLMAGQTEAGWIRVKSRRGQAAIRFHPEKDEVEYRVEGSDPFGYPCFSKQEPKKPVVMKNRESLQLTFHTAYPDAIMQLVQIFRSSRTGDLILSASPGWDLRKRFEHPEHHSSHGSLEQEHMLIPFLANTPLPDTPIRSVDIFPTLLKLTGKDIPESLDGISLV